MQCLNYWRLGGLNPQLFAPNFRHESKATVAVSMSIMMKVVGIIISSCRDCDIAELRVTPVPCCAQCMILPP